MKSQKKVKSQKRIKELSGINRTFFNTKQANHMALTHESPATPTNKILAKGVKTQGRASSRMRKNELRKYLIQKMKRQNKKQLA